MVEARHALVVATNRYSDTRLPPLDAPRQDASALRKVLGDDEIGAFDVQVALNSKVQALRKTLEAFFAHRDRDDLLLVHFSCHGLKDESGQLYLAASDTEVGLLKATALDTDWLRQLMNDCRSEKIAIFLDCCFGGAFAAGMVHRVGIDSPGIKEHLGGPGGTGRVVITASNAVQYAFESGNRVGTPEPSVFTKALVDGLKSGEADRNRDGAVTINELFEYLADKVREASPGQTPTKWEFNAEGDWMIARSARPAGSIEQLPEDVRTLLTSPDTVHRLAALTELGTLAASADPVMVASARLAIEGLAADDSQKVSSGAKRLLAELADAPTEDDRRAQEQAEADRVAKEAAEAAAIAAAKAEADRQAQEKAAADADRQTREKAAADAGAAAEALAAARAAADRQARAKAEADAAAERKAHEEAAAAAAAAAAQAEAERRARRKRIAVIGLAGSAFALVAGVGLAAFTCVGRDCASPTASLRPSSAAAASGSTAVASSSAAAASGSPAAPSASNGSSAVVVGPILPDTRIVFGAVVGGDADLWVAPPDGSSPTSLVSGTGTQTDPSWSPDRTQVVYRGPTGLSIVTSDGKPMPNFTHHSEDLNPAWSPDRLTIAFASDRSFGNLEIYRRAIADLTGLPQRLTTNVVDDWDPSWSPQGDRIAFASRRAGRQWIYTMRASDGKNVVPVTSDQGIYDDPSWSPDGNWIAATRRATKTAPKELWLMRSDGKEGKIIASGDENANDPTWSPDSVYIAFARAGAIVIVDRNGTQAGTFSIPNASSGFPDWR